MLLALVYLFLLSMFDLYNTLANETVADEAKLTAKRASSTSHGFRMFVSAGISVPTCSFQEEVTDRLEHTKVRVALLVR